MVECSTKDRVLVFSFLKSIIVHLFPELLHKDYSTIARTCVDVLQCGAEEKIKNHFMYLRRYTLLSKKK